MVNAVYHRSYEIREPIEVQVNRDNIRIVSHPGVDHSIPLEDVKKGNMLARRYRKRRIGEFLKEFDFTEGRGTGLPKMRHALERNSSPKAIFPTDEARTYFYTEIQINKEFLDSTAQTEALDVAHEGGHDVLSMSLSETDQKLLKLLSNKPLAMPLILEGLGYSRRSRNRNVRKEKHTWHEFFYKENTVMSGVKTCARNSRPLVILSWR